MLWKLYIFKLTKYHKGLLSISLIYLFGKTLATYTLSVVSKNGLEIWNFYNIYTPIADLQIMLTVLIYT